MEALTSGDLSCEQTTVIKMKTNKEHEVQLVKNVEGNCPEDFRVANPEDFEGNGKGSTITHFTSNCISPPFKRTLIIIWYDR